ncbi:MAG: class D sortase [Oscillospiraceae bacterium]|nr:class D sortase [Oscillospiraceae bacterium]
MAEQTTKRRGNVLPYLLTPLLLLLLTAGVLMLCYYLAPTHQIQKYLNIVFMDDLKTTNQTAGLNIIEHGDIPMGSMPEGETYEEGRIIYPTFGEQYAQLEIDSISLSVGVYYGVNPELLERGACHSSQSAIIGETGNAVIDAHVNTFFSDLNRVKKGDTVRLFTKYGAFDYKVTDLIEFSKDEKQYLASGKDQEVLTLYTCKPQVIGSSDMRIGVRCKPVKKQFYEQAADAEGGTE